MSRVLKPRANSSTASRSSSAVRPASPARIRDTNGSARSATCGTPYSMAPSAVRSRPAGSHSGTPGLHPLPLRGHRQQPVPYRKVGEPSPVEEKHRVPCDEQCPCTLLGHRREGVLELTGPARLDELKLQAERPGRALDAAHDQRLGGTVTRVREGGHAPDLGDDFLEQLQLFAENVRVDAVRYPGDVPTGRARLPTSPTSTGSVRLIPTIGIVPVVFRHRAGIRACRTAPRPRTRSCRCHTAPWLNPPRDRSQRRSFPASSLGHERSTSLRDEAVVTLPELLNLGVRGHFMPSAIVRSCMTAYDSGVTDVPTGDAVPIPNSVRISRRLTSSTRTRYVRVTPPRNPK
jgi:hypothetical protein